MLAVGVKKLKNRLSEYLRLVAGGETILVTDRDRVVAELSPPDATRLESPTDAAVVELVRKGMLTPALVRSKDPPPRASRTKPLTEILQDLSLDREDRV